MNDNFKDIKDIIYDEEFNAYIKTLDNLWRFSGSGNFPENKIISDLSEKALIASNDYENPEFIRFGDYMVKSTPFNKGEFPAEFFVSIRKGDEDKNYSYYSQRLVKGRNSIEQIMQSEKGEIISYEEIINLLFKGALPESSSDEEKIFSNTFDEYEIDFRPEWIKDYDEDGVLLPEAGHRLVISHGYRQYRMQLDKNYREWHILHLNHLR